MQKLHFKERKSRCHTGSVVTCPPIRYWTSRVEHDVKGMHGNIVALIETGLLNHIESGAIEFSYEANKIEFLLQVA